MRLVSQGRAKSYGVSWNEEELSALSLICKTFNKKMSDVAPYIRAGILTIERYKKAESRDDIINPLLKLPKDQLLQKARLLGINISPDAPVEIIAELVKEEKEKQTKKATATTIPVKVEPVTETSPVEDANAKEAKEVLDNAFTPDNTEENPVCAREIVVKEEAKKVSIALKKKESKEKKKK